VPEVPIRHLDVPEVPIRHLDVPEVAIPKPVTEMFVITTFCQKEALSNFCQHLRHLQQCVSDTVLNTPQTTRQLAKRGARSTNTRVLNLGPQAPCGLESTKYRNHGSLCYQK
jgi:hypothetical protein